LSSVKLTTTPPAAPRLSQAAFPPDAPPLPRRVPSPAPGEQGSVPQQDAGEDATMKISAEDADRTKPLS
jgi:hypothetical protein